MCITLSPHIIPLDFMAYLTHYWVLAGWFCLCYPLSTTHIITHTPHRKKIPNITPCMSEPPPITTRSISFHMLCITAPRLFCIINGPKRGCGCILSHWGWHEGTDIGYVCHKLPPGLCLVLYLTRASSLIVTLVSISHHHWICHHIYPSSICYVIMGDDWGLGFVRKMRQLKWKILSLTDWPPHCNSFLTTLHPLWLVLHQLWGKREMGNIQPCQ